MKPGKSRWAETAVQRPSSVLGPRPQAGDLNRVLGDMLSDCLGLFCVYVGRGLLNFNQII